MLRDTTIRVLVLASGAYALALLQCGCTPADRSQWSQGQKWVVDAEAERKRLNDQGFPQYNFD